MKVNVFCLPFAGGSQYSFREFQQYPATGFNLIPVELPGRGARYSEQLLTDLKDMAEDIYHQIKGRIDQPYAIYGHSMGSLLGYLLIKRIQAEKLALPLHLFVSGRGGPTVTYDQSTYALSKPEFIQKLREMGGSPDEILNSEHLMTFFEPILRADFKCAETYRYEEAAPLNVAITCMIGKSDKTTYEEALEWGEVTSKEFQAIAYEGNHFFIYQHINSILSTIERILIKEKAQYFRSVSPDVSIG